MVNPGRTLQLVTVKPVNNNDSSRHLDPEKIHPRTRRGEHPSPDPNAPAPLSARDAELIAKLAEAFDAKLISIGPPHTYVPAVPADLPSTNDAAKSDPVPEPGQRQLFANTHEVPEQLSLFAADSPDQIPQEPAPEPNVVQTSATTPSELEAILDKGNTEHIKPLDVTRPPKLRLGIIRTANGASYAPPNSGGK